MGIHPSKPFCQPFGLQIGVRWVYIIKFMLKLYNTLTKKVEEFKPRQENLVTLYACGPTVYDYVHIGNLRTFTLTDLLVRTLKYLGYQVKFVENVTDVGHLVSDNDSGEDKMEKGARREGKTAWDIAKFYIAAFLADSRKLNLLEPDVRPKPTEHIVEQIAMVQKLLDKGYAYRIADGIYFDTSKFPDYGVLTGQNREELKAGARVEVNPQKKNPHDFALWKLSPQDKKRDMEWDSPWGKGFPGWHIECSAMSTKYLGSQLDIHAGGMDLIPVHHTNEIAQSEAASGVSPFVRYWVHGQFILVDGEKMAKSKNNFYRLADIEQKGFAPLALRYLYLTAHYRAFLNFTWQALSAAQEALRQLGEQVRLLRAQSATRQTLSQEKLVKVDTYRAKFKESLENDLNFPQALATVWEVIKSNIPAADKHDLLIDFDEVLGLGLKDLDIKASEFVTVENLPPAVKQLVENRETLRKQKKFAAADQIRQQLEAKDYLIEDTPTGLRVKKKDQLKAQTLVTKDKPGLVVLFGSGEMSPTGRKIHEKVFKLSSLVAPVKIGILETPTGFEVNAIHGWPERMQVFLEKSLRNFKPQVTRIRAWRRDRDPSTNDPQVVDAILTQDYLYCGAGSPGYAIRHLSGTRGWTNLVKAHAESRTLVLGSATAVAVSRWAIPVYEIFKTGADLHWLDGLDFFGRYGLNLAIVPHWNNREGEDFDTTRCYLGQARFAKMRALLPSQAVILGIDEQTAAVANVGQKTMEVMGIGQVHILQGDSEKIFAAGTKFSWRELKVSG